MPFALYLLALAVFVMGTSEFMLAGLVPAIADSLAVSVGSAGYSPRLSRSGWFSVRPSWLRSRAGGPRAPRS